MKKQITETRTVEVCDICERDCGNGFHNDCYICRRRCCLTCCRLVMFYDDVRLQLLELPLKICCNCKFANDGVIEKVTLTLGKADAEIAAAIDSWRASVKERAT